MPEDLREHLSQRRALDLATEEKPRVDTLLTWGSLPRRVVSQEDTEALLSGFADLRALREWEAGDTTVEAEGMATVGQEDPASEEAGDTTVRAEMAPLMAMAGPAELPHEEMGDTTARERRDVLVPREELEETRPQPNTVRSSPPVTARMGTLSIDDSLVFEPSEVAPFRRPTRPTPPVPLPTPPLPTPPLGEIAIPRDPPDRTRWWVLTIAALLLALPVYQRLTRAPAPDPAPQVEVQPLAVAPPEVAELSEPVAETPAATPEVVEPPTAVEETPEAIEAAQAEAEREAKAKERARARRLRARRRARAKARKAEAAAKDAKPLPKYYNPLIFGEPAEAAEAERIKAGTEAKAKREKYFNPLIFGEPPAPSTGAPKTPKRNPLIFGEN